MLLLIQSTLMLLLYHFPSEDHYFKELQLKTPSGGMVHREVTKKIQGKSGFAGLYYFCVLYA